MKIKRYLFKEVATIVTGNTPSTKKEEYYNGSVPFVSPADLGTFRVIKETKKYLSEEGKKQGRVIPENAVMLCCIGATIGKVGIAGKELVTNQQINSLVFHEDKVDSLFGYYFCTTLKPLLVGKSHSTTLPIISKGKLSNFKISLPPLAEQKRIANILDQADQLRQLNQQILAQYDALTKSLFLDMFGDPIANPMGWEKKKLKDVSTKILSGTTPKGGSNVYVEKGITFFRSQNVWKNRLVFENVAYIDQSTHDKMTKSSLKHGDILMTKTGRVNTENSSLGRAAMFLGEDDSANVNGHVYLIRLQENIVNEFVLFILTTNRYRDYIRSVCVGGIDKRQINKEHLEVFPIISPPITLQNQFAEKVKNIEAQKAQAQAVLEESENLFNCLLQKAFKGDL